MIQELQVCNFLSDSLKFSKQKYRHTNLIGQFIMVGGLRLTVYLTSKLDKWLMDGLMWTYRVTLSTKTSDALKGRQTDRQPDWRTESVTGRRINSLMVDGQTDWRTDELTNWRTDELTVWQTNKLADWWTDRQTDWLTDKLTEGGLKGKRTDELTQRNTDRGKRVKTDTGMIEKLTDSNQLTN